MPLARCSVPEYFAFGVTTHDGRAGNLGISLPDLVICNVITLISSGTDDTQNKLMVTFGTGDAACSRHRQLCCAPLRYHILFLYT